MLCREIVKPDLFAPVFTKGPEIPEFAKGKASVVGARASSSRAPVPPSAPAPGRKGGSAISRFFQAMFANCRDARAYSHEARELAKEGRRIQNANRRAAGLLTEEDDKSLAPTAFQDIPMPPVTDDDFIFGAAYDEDEDEEDEDE